MRLPSAICAVFWATAGAAVSGADAAEPPAATLSAPDQTFEDGLRHYDAGRYQEAIALFEQVYQQTRAPAVLFNIAQAARLSGDCPRAVAHYRRFVTDAPEAPDRPRAEAWLAKLASCPGPPPPPLPAPPPLLPAGPPPAPIAEAPPLAVAPATVTTVAAAPLPASSDRRHLLGGLLLGGAATLAGAGGVFAWRADDAADQVSALSRNRTEWDESAAALDQDGRRAERWAIGLFSAAAAVTAAGLYLLLRGP